MKLDPSRPEVQAATGAREPRGWKKRLAPVVVAVISGLVAFAVVGALLDNDDSAEERVQDYLTGEGQEEFFAADAGFRATFPTVPERSTQNIDLGGTPTVMTMYVSEVQEGAFVVGVFDLAQGMPFDFNLSVNGSAAAVNGRVENSRLVKFQGFDAAETLISAPNGAFAQGLVIRAPNRVYQLQVIARDNPPEGYERFKQSFQIASP